MLKKLGNNLLTGIIISLPIVVTVFVFVLLIRNIGTPVSQTLILPLFALFDKAFPDTGVGKMLLDIFSTFIVLIFITALGVFSRFFFAKMLINLSEAAINKIPGIGTVYRTVKQIVDTFSKQNKAVFQYVVMVEFPRKGLYSIGFVTSTARGEVQARTGETVINVFVPTTPNPTSGFLIMVAESEIKKLDMTVGEAMKLVISGGAVVPPWKNEPAAKE